MEASKIIFAVPVPRGTGGIALQRIGVARDRAGKVLPTWAVLAEEYRAELSGLADRAAGLT